MADTRLWCPELGVARDDDGRRALWVPILPPLKPFRHRADPRSPPVVYSNALMAAYAASLVLTGLGR